MVCAWCHEFCGDQGFCGPDCYEQYEEARADLMAKSECDALLDPEPPPFNEAFGSKGNN